MTPLPAGSVTGEGGDLTVDAAVLAPRLGLSRARMQAEMRRGIVYSRVERGVGQDKGYWRITVTYRSRAVRLLVAPSGTAYEIAPPSRPAARATPPLVALARRAAGPDGAA